MQAKPGVVDYLNQHLTVELTAINTYFLQAELCRSWGYQRLFERFRALSMDEMKDTEELVERIVYLEGLPNMQRLNTIVVGENVLECLRGDLELEKSAVALLQEAITHCQQVGDYTTRGMLEEMITDEEEHVDWFETQLTTIEQVGLENYLSQQIVKD
ncbi:MAG: bacterioferritin [Dehalococcoidia bacterium]|jgi:bacterioferritin|nr:bacterioferritin [Dehalococcoidia bacterium]